MAIVFDGREIVAGERRRTITFTELGVDWAAAGYTLKLRVTDPDRNPLLYDLDAVAAHTDQAKLPNTIGVFPTAGIYVLKGIAYTGSTAFELATINYSIEVQP